MKNDGALVPGNDHDVVEGTWPVLDQRDHGPPGTDFSGQLRLAGLDAKCPEPAAPDVSGENVGADAGGAPIDQRGERFGGKTLDAPVAEDHRCRGPAAQRFALGNVRDVEQRQRLRTRRAS